MWKFVKLFEFMHKIRKLGKKQFCRKFFDIEFSTYVRESAFSSNRTSWLMWDHPFLNKLPMMPSGLKVLIVAAEYCLKNSVWWGDIVDICSGKICKFLQISFRMFNLSIFFWQQLMKKIDEQIRISVYTLLFSLTHFQISFVSWLFSLFCPLFVVFSWLDK